MNSVYVASKPPLKVFAQTCENFQQRSCKAFTGLSNSAQSVGRTPSTKNLGQTDPPPFKNAEFQSIFARSTKAVTSSEKIQL